MWAEMEAQGRWSGGESSDDGSSKGNVECTYADLTDTDLVT